jgi:hypothetical protein
LFFRVIPDPYLAQFYCRSFPATANCSCLGLAWHASVSVANLSQKKRHQWSDFKGTAHVASSQDASLKNFPDFQAPLACYMLWAMGDIMKSLKKDSIDDEVNVSGV